jgi:hypothetical protein
VCICFIVWKELSSAGGHSRDKDRDRAGEDANPSEAG